MSKHLLFLFISLFTASVAFAQGGTITGKLLDATTKEPLIGATVGVKGTTNATAAGLDGTFKLTAPTGSTLVISYIGYVSKEITVSGTKLGEIFLDQVSSSVKEVTVSANSSLAIDRQTPIAVSSVGAQYIEEKGAGAEFPELLKSTPGVTVTRSGGGYGDSRIAIRGFNSNNLALLINGLPVQDPEAGRIYWNDWMGLADVTTFMQVQRGISASTVTVPSLGGTININTKSTELEQGGTVSQSIGSFNAQKTVVTYATGLTDKGWASSFLLSKAKGDGNAEGLYYTGYNYFFNISKLIGKSQTISASLMGASQSHGQRYSYNTINTYRAAPQGVRYNSDYGYLNGQLLSAEVNFYNKPLASVVHNWVINDKSSLSTSLYGTWGTGAAQFIAGTQAGLLPGGTVPRTGDAYSPIDFNAIVKTNLANVAGNSTTYIQNAANDHQQYGLLSTYKTKVGDNLNLLGGLDLRTYSGSHYYQLTNLLGGSYFVDNTDLNNPNRHTVVGDRINRNYIFDINSQGLYVQAEYAKDNFSAFVAGAANNTENRRIDYYSYLISDPNRTSKWVNFLGYQGKGGANYNIDQQNNVFLNVGYVRRAPLVANIFLNNRNDLNTSAKPEKLQTIELGYGFTSSMFSAKINAYHSQYNDRAKTFSGTVNQDGSINTLNVSGINELHQGIEAEFKFRPVKEVTIFGNASVGDYHYTSNTGAAQITNDKNNNVVNVPALYLKGIKIGDFGGSAASNAQTTVNGGADVQVLPQIKIGGNINYLANFNASYDPSKLTAASGFDVNQFKPLAIPNFSTVDLNIVYRFKLAGLDASFIGNVYNVFNTVYLTEAYEGTPSTAAYVTRLNALGVNYGTVRTFMTTLKIKF